MAQVKTFVPKPATKFGKFMKELFALHEIKFEKIESWLKLQPANDKGEPAKGMMPLNIERIGENTISIMHSYIQNGDVMRDPDIVFWINPKTGDWYPISYQQDNLGIYHEPMVITEERGADGKLFAKEIRVFPERYKDLRHFCESTWAGNLKATFGKKEGVLVLQKREGMIGQCPQCGLDEADCECTLGGE